MASLREKMLKASKSPYAGFFDDGEYGKIRDYTDMGAVILNLQVSGDPFKGFPSGRVVQFAGPESVGKSYVCLETVIAAQKNGYFIIYYDTEAAADKESLISRGIDPESFMYVPMPMVEELNTSLLNILDEAASKEKVMVVIDSLGNLSTRKELEDTKEGNDKRDMTRAQRLRALFRTCTVKAGMKNIPIAAVNHVYASNSMFGPPTVVSGGGGPAYANSCTLEFTKAQLKDGDDIVGGLFTSKATKNRLAREKTKVKFKIHHGHGLCRYSGLDAIAEATNWLILPKGGRAYRLNLGGQLPAECGNLRKKEEKEFYAKWLEELPTVSKKIVEDGIDEAFWLPFLKEHGFADVLREMFAYGESTAELDFTADVEEIE